MMSTLDQALSRKRPDAPSFQKLNQRVKPVIDIRLNKKNKIRLRPIELEDQGLMAKFHTLLSEESVYLRYFDHASLESRTLPERLRKICTNTTTSFAIVAQRVPEVGQIKEILAVGRLMTTRFSGVVEFALLIRDDQLSTTLPEVLLKRLIVLARGYGFHTLTSEALMADHEMLELCRNQGFIPDIEREEGLVRVTYPLEKSPV